MESTIAAESPMYKMLKTHLIFIYTDIIREHFVGDSLAPVLRVIPLQRKDEDTMCNITFPNPYYFKLKSNSIDSINVLILDETGKQIRFESGRILINLHFRKSI